MLDMLRSEEQWPLNGLPSYTILQIEVFCKRTGKGNKTSYIETFMLLHLEEKKSEGTHFVPQATSMVGQFSVLISCMRPGVSPGLEVSDFNFTHRSPRITLTVGNKMTDSLTPLSFVN